MHQPSEYDAFADIYDIWVETAPITQHNLPFYVEEYLATPGPVVELGIGNGRIAIAAALRGKPVIGVDNAVDMLKLCRERAAEAGVTGLLTLIQADMRDFTLPEPAQLITIPFHSIGHLASLEDKQAGLCQIYSQLAPGGRLIFDTFVFNPELAQRRQGVVGLRAECRDASTGHDVLLWTTARYDWEAQLIRIIARTDELDDKGTMLHCRYRRLTFSWLDAEQARALLEETGFEIETVYGDFDRSPFDEDSIEHIWVARRPAGD